MDNFIERMIERLQGRVLNVSPDRRARKVAIVNTFARKMKTDKKKDSPSPLCNTKALTYKQVNEAFTDLSFIKTTDSSEKKEAEEGPEKLKIYEREGSLINRRSLARNWEIGKNEGKKTQTENSQVQGIKEEVKRCNSVPAEVHHSLKGSDLGCVCAGSPGLEWDSLGFSSNLMSIPSVSTSNLLEEIEDGLPSSYSLVNMLDYTPHTVTNVRTCARLSRIGKNLVQVEEDAKQLQDSQEDMINKLKHLQREGFCEKTLIDQASKVIKLCKDKRKNVDFDYVDTLKNLLVAKLRYDAINMEMQNVKLSGGEAKEDNYGEISISDVEFTLNDVEVLERGPLICIAFQRKNLFASHLQKEITGNKLHFSVDFKFENLHQNFIVYLELYQLNYSLKSRKAEPKFWEFKNLIKIGKLKTDRDGCEKSEEQDFFCLGTASLRLSDIRRCRNGRVNLDFHNVLRLDFEKTISVNLRKKVYLNTELSGFLNLFKNTCWHRLWCCLTDCYLRFWNYPEDKDNGKHAFESIFLLHCRDVEPVSIEVCIRPYTFMMSHEEDKRILLSASSHREMISWINRLKSIIHCFELWNSDF